MPYADISKPPAPLPSAKLQVLRPGVSLQPPLTRLGSGPGLILFTTEDVYDEEVTQRDDAPTAVLKWAEEGYTVVQISAAAVEPSKIEALLTEAFEALDRCEVCQPKDKVGLVCKSHSAQLTQVIWLLIECLGYTNVIWDLSKPAFARFPRFVAGVVYVDGSESEACGTDNLSLLKHVAGPPKQIVSMTFGSLNKEYYYPNAQGQWFSAGGADFDYSAESVAHTRNLQFLKPKMGGPYFDLEEIWEEHTYYEFADRSVEHTMSTMVQEPYVNHVPTVRSSIRTI
jgi:carboxymethylenebutenolidase